MADKTLTMKFVIDSAQVDKAAASYKNLATQVGGVDRATKQLGTTQKHNLQAVANVQQQIASGLTVPGLPANARAGVQGQGQAGVGGALQQAGFGGLAKFGKPIGAAIAAGAVGQAGAQGVARQGRTGSFGLGSFALDVAGAVPGLGFVTEAGRGLYNSKYDATKAIVEQYSGQRDFRRGQQELIGASQTPADAARAAYRQSSGQAAGARGFSNFLNTPGFDFGQYEGESGGLRLARDQARNQSGTATRIRASEEGSLRELESKRDASAAARDRLERESREADAKIGKSSGEQEQFDFANAASKRKDLEDAIVNAKNDQLRVDQQLKEVEKSRLSEAKAIADAAQAELNIKKDLLNKSGAAAQLFGSTDPATRERLKNISRKFKEGGIDSLNQEEAAALKQFPGAQDVIEKAERERGQKNFGGDISEISGNLGIADLGDFKARQEEFIKATAEANAANMERLAEAAKQSMNDLTTAIVETLKNALLAAQSQFNEKVAAEKFENSKT